MLLSVSDPGRDELIPFSAVTAGVGAGLAFGKEVVALTELLMCELGRLAEHHQVGERRLQLSERSVIFEPCLGLPDTDVDAGITLARERQFRADATNPDRDSFVRMVIRE